MPDKREVINSIVKVAKKLGHTPSILEFAARSEISRCSLFKTFPKWNQAVRAAGLKPNRVHVRPEDSELLKDWGEVVRKKRIIPSPWAYRLAGKYYPLTLAKRFGGWDSVPQAFRNFAKGKREWRDVLALLPAPPPNDKPAPAALLSPRVRSGLVPLQSRRLLSKKRPSPVPRQETCHARLKDRPTYGDSTSFPWLGHEPLNEQGVVLLFGMLAKDLGYKVENVQKGFPDCEAMRQIAPGRWQRVRIEFEFESKNFHGHGHSVNGCDVIVCWRHNWPACPKHIEVLELSRVIESPASTED